MGPNDEIDLIEQQYADGLISLKDRNDAIRDIERAARDYAEEMAQEAYRREMEFYGYGGGGW